jgi:uncharacterized membrane protein
MNQLIAPSKKRITSIDLLRGIIMVIMALDHVRDFLHAQAMTGDPTNMQTTTPQLFFTRWITHYCAPIFVFLSGTSIYLQGLRKTKKELSIFLIKRGLWLVFAEITILTLGWTFNPLYNLLFIQVIWAIGISMVIIGILIRTSYNVILITGLLIVFFHNLLDYPEAARNQQVGFWWNFLHHARFSIYEIFPNHFALILYAFVPWTGVMCLGYCLGKFFNPNVTVEQRRKKLLQLGSLTILFFIVIRFINLYGDPAPWSVQRNAVFTFLSFINVTKYPPSLMYISMTIGPALIALALFENVKNKVSDFFTVFGRVPFFYYILHLFLIHGLTVLGFYLSGYGSKDIVSSNIPFLFRPASFGYSLKIVYLIWIFVIIILYPLCKWYNKYKSTHNKWWLSYI